MATADGKITGDADAAGLVLQVPASINRYLRSYQREGVRFLFRQYARGTGGCLADDMGLGKTIQTVAFMAALLQKTGGPEDANPSAAGRHPILVVCPTSVLTNWERELFTWGRFRVGTFSGALQEEVLRSAKARELEVVLLSYQAFRAHAERLAGVDFHAAIFDEVHTVKNMRSKTWQAFHDSLGTALRYGLTGCDNGL